MKKKPQKFIAVVLAIISLLSACNLGVFAVYNGVPGNVTKPSNASGNYTIQSLNGDGQDFVFGYRFSVVNAYGATLKDRETYRTIDLVRTGSDRANTAFNSSKKLTAKRNKYQLYDLYINNKNIDVSYGGNSSSDTYGIKQASGYSTALGSVESVEAWMNRSDNRAKLLNALGYSNANQDNVRELLGTNRIVIEPLFHIKMNGVYMLLTATEAAIVSDAYGLPEKGDANTIGQYTNRHFPESLRITDNIGMPNGNPLKIVSPKSGDAGSDSNRWGCGEIIKSGLGMALYYEKNSDGTPKMPNNTHTLTVIYHKNDGSTTTYSKSYTVESGSTIGILSLSLINSYRGDTQFDRSGYSFEGWATSSSGSVAYKARENVAVTKLNANAAKQDTTVNLYAKWTQR